MDTGHLQYTNQLDLLLISLITHALSFYGKRVLAHQDDRFIKAFWSMSHHLIIKRGCSNNKDIFSALTKVDTFNTAGLTFNLLDESCLIILRQKSPGSSLRSIHQSFLVYEPISSGTFDTIGSFGYQSPLDLQPLDVHDCPETTTTTTTTTTT